MEPALIVYSCIGLISVDVGILLISETLIATEQVDNTAVGKAILGYYMAHDHIVTMGVDAQSACNAYTIIHHVIEYAMTCGCARQAMHDIIRLVV